MSLSCPRLSLALAVLLALSATPAWAGSGDLDKVNGAITAQAGQANGDLSTVNGSITLEDGTHAKDATTVNGSIRAGDNIQAGGFTTVNGSIRVGTQARLDGGLETVNGSIFVDRGGKVDRDIQSVNGAIGIVGTDVAEGIQTVNGDITVGIDSHVHGGIKVTKPTSNWMPISFSSKRKPRIIIGPNATVDGDLVFEREVTLYVHKSARVGKVTGATPVSYDTPRAPAE